VNGSMPRRWWRSPSPADTVKRLARLHTPLPVLAFHALARGAQPASSDLGHRDVHRAAHEKHGRDDPPGRQVAARSRFATSGAKLVVIVAGAPPGTVGSTNLIHVHRIGEEDV